jgi:hypothetical protein
MIGLTLALILIWMVVLTRFLAGFCGLNGRGE